MWSREWKGVEEDGRGGRRSNEPTSHGVVSTRAPLPLFSSFSSPLPTSLHLVLLLLLLSPPPSPSPSRSASCSFSRVPRHYIIHISTLVFGNVVRRSYTRSFLSLCVRALGRACNARDMQSLRGPREICRQHRVEERNSQSFCLTFARPPWKFASAVTSRQREGILCLITESIARGLRFTMLHFESILA